MHWLASPRIHFFRITKIRVSLLKHLYIEFFAERFLKKDFVKDIALFNYWMFIRFNSESLRYFVVITFKNKTLVQIAPCLS